MYNIISAGHILQASCFIFFIILNGVSYIAFIITILLVDVYRNIHVACHILCTYYSFKQNMYSFMSTFNPQTYNQSMRKLRCLMFYLNIILNRNKSAMIFKCYFLQKANSTEQAPSRGCYCQVLICQLSRLNKYGLSVLQKDTT